MNDDNVASTSEIKEDFKYAILVELGVLIAAAANVLYSGDFETLFLYVLIFLAVVLGEHLAEKGLLISKERNIVVKYQKILDEKRRTKRSIAFLLFLLIVLSSWGVLSYLTRIYYNTRNYTRALTLMIPWYIATYAVWFGLLIYMKEKHVQLLLSLLSKNRNEGKIRHVLLMFGAAVLVRESFVADGTEEKLAEQLAEHSEDFRYMGMQISVACLGKLKLGVASTGQLNSKTKLKMKDALSAIKIAYPKKFENGEFTTVERRELEMIIRRYVLS